ncbi:hypothetical protein BTL46_09950 [Bordetella holmesii]|uniref:response regulator n=1 Tax=Bordetella holmesii TaxID=35814 RepID=UPI0004598DF8|nr:response regulator transcription factor [Bordetella holmesii]AUL19756.1 hypothetical protein BTL46_09950 [Bordetella holmesii]KAK83361.1 response regulator receiver domain protein [Bordetella holmesii CDC-H809-BH]KCV00918.1 response regulator receiver domain protein [Bordetella holmesii CDC-H719-BH]SUV94768.1 virulence factors transcription regulator [Bordetella holmesii]
MQKLLIIDDHPVIRYAVKGLMEKEGFEVVGETDNGLDGITMARELLPNLVILDIAIPKLDGLEVLTRLQAHGAAHARAHPHWPTARPLCQALS